MWLLKLYYFFLILETVIFIYLGSYFHICLCHFQSFFCLSSTFFFELRLPWGTFCNLECLIWFQYNSHSILCNIRKQKRFNKLQIAVQEKKFRAMVLIIFKNNMFFVSSFHNISILKRLLVGISSQVEFIGIFSGKNNLTEDWRIYFTLLRPYSKSSLR